jgi:hypothetical protein
MKRGEAAKKVRHMFHGIGMPPSPDAAQGNLELPAATSREKAEPGEQLNARVRVGTKRRVRILATRDNIKVGEVVERAIALYEEKYGRAPEL